jgi:hypothetical protein
MAANFQGTSPDDYDPRVPNDYAAFCRRRQAGARRRDDMNNGHPDRRSERRRAETQERTMAGRATGFDRTVRPARDVGSRGRGRGRAATLPAWLTAKKSASLDPPGKAAEAQFENASSERPRAGRASLPSEEMRRKSTVVMLTNMVGAGEVGLEAETSEECAKYGRVVECAVFEEAAHRCVPEEAVRIFVRFADEAAAARAATDLNGRFFNGKRVRARFFDLGRFEKRQLAAHASE